MKVMWKINWRSGNEREGWKVALCGPNGAKVIISAAAYEEADAIARTLISGHDMLLALKAARNALFPEISNACSQALEQVQSALDNYEMPLRTS
jgi:hypothetical protein